MPIGTTNDITYDIKSNTTVSNMTVTSTGGLSATCGSYNYYGKLGKTDKLTITHPGITDYNLHFWKVRVRGGAITIDKWDNSA